MKYYPTDISIKILPLKTLEFLLQSNTSHLTIEHLAYADTIAKIQEVKPAGFSYVYVLNKIPYSWPQKSLVPFGRELFIDFAREMEPGIKRFANVNQSTDETQRRSETKLFIGSLLFSMQDQGLFKAVSQFGTVQSLKIHCDKMTNRSKGYGFVTLSNKDEAKNVVQNLNGVKILENGDFASAYDTLAQIDENSSFNPKVTVLGIIEKQVKNWPN